MARSMIVMLVTLSLATMSAPRAGATAIAETGDPSSVLTAYCEAVVAQDLTKLDKIYSQDFVLQSLPEEGPADVYTRDQELEGWKQVFQSGTRMMPAFKGNPVVNAMGPGQWRLTGLTMANQVVYRGQDGQTQETTVTIRHATVWVRLAPDLPAGFVISRMEFAI